MTAGYDVSRFGDARAAVEFWAGTDPDRLAVTAGGRSLTYGRLYRRACGLAGALAALGTGRGEPVAVVCGRGFEPLIATLACWLGDHVPVLVDAEQPDQRVRRILDDSGAVAVLAGEGAGDAHGLPVIGVEEAPDGSAPPAGGGSGAYVIYTSGSTGVPKGVLVGHPSLKRLVDWHVAEYEVTPDTRASSVSSTGFDAFVWETWPYLCAGASVHVAPAETKLSPFDLSDWFVAEGIDVSFLPTPLAEAYVRYGNSFGQLRCLLTGGDRLRLAGGHELRGFVNHYGPTEATVLATSAPVPADAEGAPPIGRPIPAARVLLVEPGEDRPVRDGIGELLIGGECLALGYWANDELTRRSFVELGGRDGVWYRTGDLARRDDDGCLWFEGRVDRQVKVRGVRVEPGEIESALLGHPAVTDIAVEQDSAGELLAFVAWRADAPGADEAGTLREFAERSLPKVMVPQRVVELDRLPLTKNGKVDRNGLREEFLQDR